MAAIDGLSQYAIRFRRVISNKHKIEDNKAKNEYRLQDAIANQEIAVEERQLEIIEEGSPDVSKLKDRITELEKEKEEQLQKSLETKAPKDPSHTNVPIKSKEPIAKTSEKKSTSRKKRSTSHNESNVSTLPTSSEYPAMRDNVIRNVAKSEREWILLYGFYSSNFGEREFTRKNITDAYSESKRKTNQRIKNVGNSINTLVKQGSIRFLNDSDMLLSESGITLAREILNR